MFWWRLQHWDSPQLTPQLSALESFVILGFLRLGKLADYFPSSAIQGMLAAIGLIILGKQIHIMLGNKIVRESGIDYLLEIPNTLITVVNYQDKGLIYAAVAG